MSGAINNDYDPKKLATKILEAVSAISEDGAGGVAKTAAVEAAKQLIHQLEDARKRSMQFMLNMRQTPIQAMCVRIAVDFNIFHILSQAKGVHVSASELAAKTNADIKLIGIDPAFFVIPASVTLLKSPADSSPVRIMRVLTASGCAAEPSGGTYSATAFSKSMTDPGMESSFRLAFDQTSLVASKAPEFFRKEGHKNPEDASRTPFKYTYDTDLEYFPWLKSHPSMLKDFATWMSTKDTVSRGWLDWFPVQGRVLDSVTPDANGHETLIVDVGGGKGHDLKRFHARFPDAKGKLILQDLPAMVPEQSPGEGFEIMCHDFFTPQPVKGARIYYLNTVLHDWPDARCRNILTHIKDAMTPGYSRIIINEAILPEKGVSLGHAARDIGMMCMLGACERTENHWRELVESSGLRVVDIWYDPVPGNGIIEAEV